LDLIKFYNTLDSPEDTNYSDRQKINYLNYAWEYFTDKHDFKGIFVDEAVTNAVRVAAETQILVIIGYSFPIFNRQTDKKIIDAMTRLQKVYVQDLYPENIYTTIKNAFKIFQTSSFDEDKVAGSKRFVLSNSLNQFVLPYEL
jgi:hypothetical protein